MLQRIIYVRPKADKLIEASEWAQEVIAFAKKKQPSRIAEVYRERFGDVGTLHFIGQFESLSDLEQSVTDLQSDEEWIALYTKGLDLFIDGSNKVILMESI